MVKAPQRRKSNVNINKTTRVVGNSEYLIIETKYYGSKERFGTFVKIGTASGAKAFRDLLLYCRSSVDGECEMPDSYETYTPFNERQKSVSIKHDDFENGRHSFTKNIQVNNSQDTGIVEIKRRESNSVPIWFNSVDEIGSLVEIINSWIECCDDESK